MKDLKELHSLIWQLKGGNRSNSLRAIEVLRERGWLTDGTLTHEDLSGAYLVEANLAEASFGRANLERADLSFADLTDADLGGTRLNGARLIEANLNRAALNFAHLTGTDLRGSTLTSSQLIETIFLGANLNNADMTAAFCRSTVFVSVDLSNVKGLSSIWHDYHSYIDVDSLYRSQGNVPDVFLRGCGIPEDFITYIRPLLGKPIDFYSCFISYSHSDKAFARRLHDALQGQGIRCWLDEHEMNPGDDIYDEIDRGIRLWDKVLLCCSRASLKSWWVDNEINKAFKKERELMAERKHKVLALIPLDLDGYLLSDEFQSGKKDEICSRVAANFQDWEHDNRIFEREFERVLKALRPGGGKESPPVAKL